MQMPITRDKYCGKLASTEVVDQSTILERGRFISIEQFSSIPGNFQAVIQPYNTGRLKFCDIHIILILKRSKFVTVVLVEK